MCGARFDSPCRVTCTGAAVYRPGARLRVRIQGLGLKSGLTRGLGGWHAGLGFGVWGEG
jgi:hypothetical protein